MRSPASLSRLRHTPGAKEVVYAGKAGHEARKPAGDERINAEDFIRREAPRGLGRFS